MKIQFTVMLPNWLKVAAKVAVPVLLVCAGGVALAAPKNFVSNETLTAKDLNASFSDLNNRAGALETTLAPTGSLSTTDVTASGDLKVAGTTDLGLRAQATCSYAPNGGSSYTDCNCASGELAVSGGAFCNTGILDGILNESRNVQVQMTGVAGATWRVSCIDTTTHARFPAAYPFALCARVKSN